MLSILSRIVTIALLVTAAAALAASHWLSGQPRVSLAVKATVSTHNGMKAPAAGIRLDVLSRSARSLIDSICRVDIVRPPHGIVRALEDQNREIYLRGAIERQGFILSPPVQRMLRDVAQIRREYMHQLSLLPRYENFLEAPHQAQGGLVSLDQPRLSVLPARLQREAMLFGNDSEEFYESKDSVPVSRAYEIHNLWTQAVETYDGGYHRDLVERAIVAAAVFRDAAVASTETDSLGRATFPALGLGDFWIAGHYPSDLYVLSREHRNMLARYTKNQTPISRIISWDSPFTLTAMSPLLELTQADAVPVEINLPY